MKNCPLSKNGCAYFNKGGVGDIIGRCLARAGCERDILISDTHCPCPKLMIEPEKSLAERVADRHYGDYAENQYSEKKVELKNIINEELEKENNG